VALLICCSARNTAHVGDLYPTSSNSSVRFVSFRIVGNQRLLVAFPTLLFFHSPLLIVHPCPGSRHMVRPSVVMSLVSSTCSLHTCDETMILTKPCAGIFWSKNQSFHISSDVSCSRSRRGSYAAVGFKGASHRMLLRMNSFLSIGLPLTMSGLGRCVEFCFEGSISLLRS